MPKTKVLPSGLHAVLSIDPGGTTGVAAGTFDLKPMLKETLTDGRVMYKTMEVKGQWVHQVEQLCNVFIRWRFRHVNEVGLPVQNLHLVIEDYRRRPTAASSNLDPVWIASAFWFRVMALVEDVAWQQPGDAKGFATNDRLRLWDLWAVGSEHERDANRHLAVRVNRLISGK